MGSLLAILHLVQDLIHFLGGWERLLVSEDRPEVTEQFVPELDAAGRVGIVPGCPVPDRAHGLPDGFQAGQDCKFRRKVVKLSCPRDQGSRRGNPPVEHLSCGFCFQHSQQRLIAAQLLNHTFHAGFYVSHKKSIVDLLLQRDEILRAAQRNPHSRHIDPLDHPEQDLAAPRLDIGLDAVHLHPLH